MSKFAVEPPPCLRAVFRVFSERRFSCMFSGRGDATGSRDCLVEEPSVMMNLFATFLTGGYTDGTTSYYYLQAPRNVFLTARVVF